MLKRIMQGLAAAGVVAALSSPASALSAVEPAVEPASATACSTVETIDHEKVFSELEELSELTGPFAR